MATVPQFVPTVASCMRLCYLRGAGVTLSKPDPADVTEAAAADGYVLHQHTTSYTVAGDDAGTVRQALDRLGPVGTNGRHSRGCTR
jgi:hypothetical protein